MAVFPVTKDISFCQNTGPNSSLNLNIYMDNAFLGSIYDKNTIKDQVKKKSITNKWTNNVLGSSDPWQKQNFTDVSC